MLEMEEENQFKDVTLEFLTQEVSATEIELEDTERRLRQVLDEEEEKDQQQKQQQMAQEDATTNDDNYYNYGNVSGDGDDDGDPQRRQLGIVVNQLVTIETSVEALRFIQDVADWKSSIVLPSSSSPTANDKDDDDDNTHLDIIQEVQLCYDLALLLLRYDSNLIVQMNSELYTTQYLSLYTYCYEFLKRLFQQELELSRYPNPQGCYQLVRQCYTHTQHRHRRHKNNNNNNHRFPVLASWLTRLETIHSKVQNHMRNDDEDDDNTNTSPSYSRQQRQQQKPIVLIELFLPLVERIQFHFLQPSEDRLTSTRTDRLVEWLLTYVREKILFSSSSSVPEIGRRGSSSSTSTSSPWELVSQGISQYCVGCEELSILFLQELIQLLIGVLIQRQFFRHSTIAGLQSNPLLLCNAIEQLYQFDEFIQSLLVEDIQQHKHQHKHHQQQRRILNVTTTTTTTKPKDDDDDDDNLPSTSTSLNNHRLIGLVDTFVTQDEELFQWYIAREREIVFSTLFESEDDSITARTTNTSIRNTTHVSPRAELFCALIRSVQTKASIMAEPGPYLRQVAVPLCMQFVDAVHDTSNDLKRLLLYQSKPSSHHHHGSGGSALVHLEDLTSNVQEWIELINGTHLAALVLLRQDSWQQGGTLATQADHDLARFGQSLERLESVLVEEFAATFVETILMERAKLATYLMMASHLLASETWDHSDATNENDLSPELKETHVVLTQFLYVCARATTTIGINNNNHKKNSNSNNNSKGDGRNNNNDDEYHNKDGTTPGGGDSSGSSQLGMIPIVARFAPNAMRDHVLNRLADKFMEVALDVHSMTPDIWHQGATIFARDVSILMGGGSGSNNRRNLVRGGSRGTNTGVSGSSSSSSLPMVLRLLELSRLLSLDSASLMGLFHALAGLAGTTFLDPNDFSSDGTLHQEAMSMIHAKGFVHLELEDVLSILNRRRDLSSIPS